MCHLELAAQVGAEGRELLSLALAVLVESHFVALVGALLQDHPTVQLNVADVWVLLWRQQRQETLQKSNRQLGHGAHPVSQQTASSCSSMPFCISTVPMPIHADRGAAKAAWMQQSNLSSIRPLHDVTIPWAPATTDEHMILLLAEAAS